MKMRSKRAKGAKKKDPIADAAVDYFAARSHEAWRRKLLQTNPEQRGQPRMRRRGGTMVDVNQPWAKLHPKAKADNKNAAYAAYAATRKFPGNREAAAAFVHRAWIKRNTGDRSQPKALFKPYSQLPEVEKDKDRAHIDNMKKAIAAVQRRMRKSAPGRKRPTAKRARAHTAGPLTLDLSAKDLRRIEAARKRLSQVLGRPVPVEAVVLAGAEAVATLCKVMAAPAKPKRR
jgi:hypothetical protein